MYKNEIFNWTKRQNICKRIWIFTFAENLVKNLSNKYGQNLHHSAEKPTTDPIKIAQKRAIQKTAEATGDLIGNKSTDKITSVSKQSTKKLYNNDETEEDVERVTHKKRYISPEERRQIIDELRLIPRKGAYFQKLLIDWLIDWLMLTLQNMQSPEERQHIFMN